VEDEKYHVGMFSKVKVEVSQLLETSFTEYRIEKKNRKKFIESNRVFDIINPYIPK